MLFLILSTEMKAVLFYFLVLLLSSCTRSLFLASPSDPTSTPTIVRLDSLGQVNAGKIKFNGPVTIQHGTGNVASTTKTNNTGRAASSGANGGQSVETTTNKMPVWGIVVLMLVGAVGGVVAYRKWWPRRRVAAASLLLLLPLVSQADDVSPPKYSYRQARMVERRYNKAVRYYHRKNRRDNRELKRDRKIQIKRLKRDHP